MAKPKKKLTKEEILEKKRIAEKLRYEKIKNDPQRLAAEKEKRKLKYKKLRECGKKKLVSEMSAREKRQARKNWREYSDKSYKKKKLKTNMTNQFIRENTPSSLTDEPVSPGFRNHAQAQQEIQNINVSQPPTPNLRLQSARKRSQLQRFNRNQELKQKNVLIVSLKQKLNKYKKSIHQVQGSTFMPRKLQMKSLSCFCEEGIMCSHYRMGLLEYPAKPRQNVDDVYESEVPEQIKCTSPDKTNTVTKYTTDQSDNISVASDLTLNLENPEVLATIPDLQIDPTTLFPDLSQDTLIQKKDDRNIKKEKRKVEVQPKKKKKLMTRKDKVKKATNYKKENAKLNSNLKKRTEPKKVRKNKKYEFSDCECLICGALYSEDTTGNDWVQCLACHTWTQEGCIKGESTLFKCSDCLADCDYKK